MTAAPGLAEKLACDPLVPFLDLLRCPISGAALRLEHGTLVTADGARRYRCNHAGIALFAQDNLSPQAQVQQRHYDKIASAYIANLEYPHTREYLAYLDGAVLEAVGQRELGTVAELCCGRGEALVLLGSRISRYVGVDISEQMLTATRALHSQPYTVFMQGDATRLPLAPACIDTVIVLGGVHHVPDRPALFAEIARILKPGGRFFYREPVNDFVLWRALRALVYRLSPLLDPATERPLIYGETVPVMERAGLRPLQ